jgi:Concanavalin A-like lectin/glucanases superfamily
MLVKYIMNPVVIFLGIVVVLLLWYLYTYYLSATSLSNGQVNLNNGTVTVSAKNLANPGSANFSYGVWVYVNSWNNTTATKPIISRGNFKITLDEKTPTLTCQLPTTAIQTKITKATASPPVTLTAAETAAAAKDTVTVTNSFPIQKWVYIVVSVDGTTMDAYLDGKLVLSKQLSGPIVSDTVFDLVLGGTPNPDFYLTKVNWWPTAMNPQLAWNYYLQGNGLPSSSNYNVKLEVLQDNVQQKQFTLF